PDLAGLVRYFTLHVARPPSIGEGFSEELEEPMEFDDGVYTTAFHVSSLSEKGNINCLEQYSRTHKSYYDIIFALLLLALLKVEILELDLKIGFDTYYLEEMIRRAGYKGMPFDIQPSFEALTVFVHSRDLFNPRSRSSIASLLKLPAIQKISRGFGNTWNARYYETDAIKGSSDTDKNLIELDRSSSPLTSLDLVAYRLSAADLRNLLRAPKALKTLFSQTCLESLSLQCEKDYSESYEPMTSLISFNNLRVFKTAAVFLAKTENGTKRDNLMDIFPPNLETLHLTHFEARYEGVLEALEHLLSQTSPRQIPSLTKLILEKTYFYDASYGGRTGARADSLMEDGAALDVTKGSNDELFLDLLRELPTFDPEEGSDTMDIFAEEWSDEESIGIQLDI
ncbi:hypothetical protein MMC22_011197, partial [Lobaria immixta]|nr:hypothetical protein [Lobaria immixta]